ncbi:hypothetical protein Tco_0864514 [Tanacetum coccineum]
MYCDNTGAIAIAKDHGVTKGARHFRAKVHYLQETIETGDVRIEKVDTDDTLADPVTKALAFPKHSELTKKIGMIPVSSLIRTHCKHTAEDDLEVFSTDDLSFDWISAHNFLTRLQKLSSYASGHLEVSELAAFLEKASFSNTSTHDEVF